ncbi:uncharacterized protein LOC107368718 [Tetranychus urticae]|uniref:F-box domain-containing protein n=1 Tax=Tetranychus urticae TaxID=32264 RepID=T1KZR7_TETUR|nr:uncharacterized protein LOC107368718 [Tetranychus urticae]
MSFDILPNEIIVHILNQTSWIGDLINASKVCRRWYHIVQDRLAHVKYLVYKAAKLRGSKRGRTNRLFADGLDFQRDVLFYKGSPKHDKTNLVTCVKNLPNVNMVEVYEYNGIVEKLVECLFTYRQDVIGVWHHDPFTDKSDKFRVSTVIIEYGPSPNFQQLLTGSVTVELANILPRLVNLKRLHIDFFEPNSLVGYNGPPFEYIEMLELAGLEQLNLLDLVDRCPNLKSMSLNFVRCSDFGLTDTKNLNLENLVLEYEDESYQSWPILLPFLKKFPNLSALAIRNNSAFHDLLVREVLHLFPRLEILDVRGCPLTDAILQHINSAKEKSKIKLDKFIWGPIPDDYYLRELSDPVVDGTDFLEQIFPNSFPNIPIFLRLESPETQQD